MERNQIGNEHISTPGRHHVPIEQSCQGTPHDRSVLHSLDPEEECKDEKEDGNCFVIVTSSHGTGDVTRRNSDKGSG